ncbi:MAG TPA: hypothetical protein VGK19_02745 [Capsulimonadaceae bacterium]|jgi:hypothetical protein
MSDSTSNSKTSETVTPAANFFNLGSELLNEVQHTLGSSRIKSLRLTLGHRVIKEFPVSPATAIATVAIVIIAILVSNLKIEIVKEPLPDTSPAASAPGGAS